MLNKKILATAVALACSTSAFADVDLNATTSQTVTIATESLGSTPTATVEVTNAASALDVTVESGFTTGAGTSNFVRFDLTNAAFSSNAPVLDVSSTAGATSVVSQGGGDGDAFVIFEVVAGSTDIANDAAFILQASTYDVSSTATSTVEYGFYETASDAVGQSGALASASSSFTTVDSAVTGTFTKPGTAVVTVASGFTTFEGQTAGGIAAVGQIVPNDVVKMGSIKLDGSAFGVADVITGTTQTITIDGDFSFGTFSLQAATTCTAGTASNLSVASDDASATVVADPKSATTWTFCAELDGTEVAKKGSYTVGLERPDAEAALGQITFDTTTVQVPYLTTFSSYNQRLYLINRGTRDALYTISFTTEAEATATPEAGATGTVPAGEVIALKASDIVTLTGRTRTAATVELEAVDSEVSVASQSVNLSDGSTDTVVHN